MRPKGCPPCVPKNGWPAVATATRQRGEWPKSGGHFRQKVRASMPNTVGESCEYRSRLRGSGRDAAFQEGRVGRDRTPRRSGACIGHGTIQGGGASVAQELQTLVLNEQGDRFIERSAPSAQGALISCLICGAELGVKDTKRLVYRTGFGKVSLRSPRFYSHCSACGLVQATRKRCHRSRPGRCCPPGRHDESPQ